jgi:hypothetical protein
MNRRLYLIIGAQRSGKSYFSNKLIEQYKAAGNSAFVYNLGKPTDFKAAREIFLFSEKQHEAKEGKSWKQNPAFIWYEDNGAPKDFRNFSADFAGQAAKAATGSPLITRLLFETFFLYVSNSLFVVDDARSLFRYGVQAEHIPMMNRINHTGRLNPVENWRANGSDVILIFHSLNHVNREIFDYATHIINFRYEVEPEFERIENDLLKRELKRSFEALQKAPQYSYTVTAINSGQTKIFIP